jgi:hypothetical protein
MKKKEFGYIHFPASLLKDIIDRKEKALLEIEKTYRNLEPTKGRAYCSINESKIMEFVKERKKESDWYELIAFIAIRSILGKSKYKVTNNKHLLSRMLGFESYMQLMNVELSDEQKKLLAKLTKADNNGTREVCKAKMRRLRDRLQLNWRVRIYSRYMKGFFVSMEDQCSIEELVTACENRRQSNRLKALKEAEKEAYLSYKTSLNNRANNTDF